MISGLVTVGWAEIGSPAPKAATRGVKLRATRATRMNRSAVLAILNQEREGVASFFGICARYMSFAKRDELEISLSCAH